MKFGIKICFIVFFVIFLHDISLVYGLSSLREEIKENENGRDKRKKRHLRFPFNSCIALAVVLAIPIILPHRSVYLSYNFETNYYLPYFDKVQGLVPIPFATIDEPGVNTGTILAYQNNIPPRGRTSGEGNDDIIPSDNSTSIVKTGNVTSKSNSIDTIKFNSSSGVIKEQNIDVEQKKTLKAKVTTDPTKKGQESISNTKTDALKSNLPKSGTKKREILTTLLSRKKFYKILMSKLEKAGLRGEDCLLKTICQTGEKPLGDYNGVLGDIFHIMFTPSTSRDESLPVRYYEAEQNGLLGTCLQYDYNCPLGIYDFVSLIK